MKAKRSSGAFLKTRINYKGTQPQCKRPGVPLSRAGGGRWIPAFAGMTWVCAGIDVGVWGNDVDGVSMTWMV